MHKYIYLLFLSLTFSSLARGQQILLKQDVDSADFDDKAFGPNGKNYYHAWIGAGAILGASDSRMPVNYARLSNYTFGVLYKRRLSGLLSAGATFDYSYTGFGLKEPSGYSFTDSVFWGKDVSHKKERISFGGLGLRAFLRFNFDPHRGNFIGHYLDLGIGPDVLLYSEYKTQDIGAHDIRIRSLFTRLPYHSPLQNYAYAKLGFNWLGLSLQYRLTDLFKSQYNFPELPRYILRLEISFLQ